MQIITKCYMFIEKKKICTTIKSGVCEESITKRYCCSSCTLGWPKKQTSIFYHGKFLLILKLFEWEI